jgi:hypothetical protein
LKKNPPLSFNIEHRLSLTFYDLEHNLVLLF